MNGWGSSETGWAGIPALTSAKQIAIRAQTGASLGTLSLPTFPEFLHPVCFVRTILLRIRATGKIPSRPDWDLLGSPYPQPADFCFGEDTAFISLVPRGKLFSRVRALRLLHYFE